MKRILSILFLVLGAGVFAFSVLFVRAQSVGSESPSIEGEAEARGIAFPVPELGNCGNKDACRTYCNEPGNMPACITFAKEHGLMNNEEAERAEKFADRVREGSGPGGCNTPTSCEAYCSDTTYIEECIKFAEEHNFKDQNVEEGKKIRTYLKAGGQLPGGCTSRESCETYCRDVDHLEECFAFAEKVGIGPASPPGQFGREEQGSRSEHIRKFVELVKKGETPGGCKSKEECETYCGADGHLEECVAFGEKAGFMTREKAEQFRKTGGKGPGGCNSPESCRAYCDDSLHREECFKFAEENGLIPKDELERAKEGWVRLRQGLEQAPPEVAGCLKSTLGPNIIEDIQSGKLTPGPAIGERVRGCFEKFGHQGVPEEAFKDAPPEVVSCLKEKFGDEFEKLRLGKEEFTPEKGDAFRVCFEKMRFMGGGEGHEGLPPEGAAGFLRSAPPAVEACLKEKLGSDFEKVKASQFIPTPDFREKMQACFESFRPDVFINGGAAPFPIREGVTYPREPATGVEGRPSPAGFPAEVVSCLKENLTETQVQALMIGREAPPEIQEVIKKCFANVTLPPPGAFPTPSDNQICIQVITPARDPATGYCKEFPTPCNVPQGWYRVQSCASEPATSPTPIYEQQPTQNICPDRETCTKNCTSAGSPYYSTDVCTKFRSFEAERSSYSNTSQSFARILGTFFGPLLNLIGQ